MPACESRASSVAQRALSQLHVRSSAAGCISDRSKRLLNMIDDFIIHKHPAHNHNPLSCDATFTYYAFGVEFVCSPNTSSPNIDPQTLRRDDLLSQVAQSDIQRTLAVR